MVTQYGKNEKEQNRKRREMKRRESYSKDFGTYYNVTSFKKDLKEFFKKDAKPETQNTNLCLLSNTMLLSI